MPKLIIIGAGVAGLSAANTLISNNIDDFIVVEANDVPGGRIHSIKHNGSYLDMGAQWIHGEDDNPVFALAKKNGLILQNTPPGKLFTSVENSTSIYEEDFFLLTDRSRVGNDVLEETSLELDNIFHRAEEYFKQKEPCNTAESVADFVENEFDKYLIASNDSIDVKNVKLGIRNWRFLIEKSDNGCRSLNEMPLSLWGRYSECAGNYYTPLKSGFIKVVDKLMEEIPKNKIFFNTAVKCIHWNDVEDSGNEKMESGLPQQIEHQVCLQLPANQEKDIQKSNMDKSSPVNCIENNSIVKCKHFPVKIETTTGSIFEADTVIITCSLGVLKENLATLFKPCLPLSKVTAISNLCFGIVNKIYLQFEHQFWKKDCVGIQLIWNEIQELHGNMQDEWWRALHGFDTVQFHPNVLCTWIAGDEAKYMESLQDEEISETCRTLLEKFLGYSVPKPTKIFRSSWGGDPFNLGSYSYAGINTTLQDIENMACPVPQSGDPRILFAGEATHFNCYSTVHGAMLSGIREANRVLQF